MQRVVDVLVIFSKYYKYINYSLHLLPVFLTQCIYSVLHLFSNYYRLAILFAFETEDGC